MMMENGRLLHTLVVIINLLPFGHGWGFLGHTAICKIAQSRLSPAAAATVKQLLPRFANNDLGLLCPWADGMKFRYPWSSQLHFIQTPDRLCSFSYARDCKDRNGVKDFCLAGAINNYTTKLLGYRNKKQQYNLTEALLFLSHFIGDIHQPLHVGFGSDKGGNTINVKWFNRTEKLHHVWDTDIIQKGKGGAANDSNIEGFIKRIQQKINTVWAKQVSAWGGNCKACPDIYAGESIKAACQWAYKGVLPGSILKDEYMKTRLPIVELRLAQAGIRLASTLNRIFKS